MGEAYRQGRRESLGDSKMGKVIKLSDPLNGKALGDFDLWYSNYPRKEQKGEAVKAWKQTEEFHPPMEELLAATDTYAEKKRHTEKQFILLPATWLRRWCWADED
jgi:hypothetical protein